MFIDNNAVGPLETNMYILFHEPAKGSFQYDPKTMQFRQVRLEECVWSTTHLLCQDVIFYQVTGIADCVRKKETPDVKDKTIMQRKYIPMNISPSRKEPVSNKNASDQWVKVPEHDKRIGQRL